MFVSCQQYVHFSLKLLYRYPTQRPIRSPTWNNVNLVSHGDELKDIANAAPDQWHVLFDNLHSLLDGFPCLLGRFLGPFPCLFGPFFYLLAEAALLLSPPSTCIFKFLTFLACFSYCQQSSRTWHPGPLSMLFHRTSPNDGTQSTPIRRSLTSSTPSATRQSCTIQFHLIVNSTSLFAKTLSCLSVLSTTSSISVGSKSWLARFLARFCSSWNFPNSTWALSGTRIPWITQGRFGCHCNTIVTIIY